MLIFDVTRTSRRADGSANGTPDTGVDRLTIQPRSKGTARITHQGFTQGSPWYYDINDAGSVNAIGRGVDHLDGSFSYTVLAVDPPFPLFVSSNPSPAEWNSRVTYPDGEGLTEYYDGRTLARSVPPGGGVPRLTISVARSFTPGTPHGSDANWERTEYWLDENGVPVSYRRLIPLPDGYQEEVAIRR